MDISFITEDLKALRAQFVASGFDLRLVGGVVRDTIAGIPAKDIDLCTDASPEQQIEIYHQHGYRAIPTGLQHGTITVVLDGTPYEITSLRIDVKTDGRHAEVEFTNDWHADLARRDLTINAMSMTFDGEIYDPFGGQQDLQDRVVRFVGDAEQRIQEDYLRILRCIRFMGRFGDINRIDHITWSAMVKNASGLKTISRERVWAEVQKIAVHDSGPFLMGTMSTVGISDYIGLPGGNGNGGIDRAKAVKSGQQCTRSPELLMGFWCGWDEKEIIKLATDWKWSRAETDHVEWVIANVFMGRDLRRLIAIDGAPREWVVELAKIEERDEFSMFVAEHWVFEPFPVTGNDLIAQGIKPGKALGDILRTMKDDWASSGYKKTKDQLLAQLTSSIQ